MMIKKIGRCLLFAALMLGLVALSTRTFADTDERQSPVARSTPPKKIAAIFQIAQAEGEGAPPLKRPLRRRRGIRRPGKTPPPEFSAPDTFQPEILPEDPGVLPPRPGRLPEKGSVLRRRRPPAFPDQKDLKTVVLPKKTRKPFPKVDFGELGAPLPLPDRWRIVDAPILGARRSLLDPYSTGNILKGDRPIKDDWFVNLGLVWDTLIEPRYVPTPVGNATTDRPRSLDTFGDGAQVVFSQTIITEFVLYKGDSVFRPPDIEFRFTPVFNYNHVELEERGALNVNPNRGTSRTKSFLGIQTAFVDFHLRNVSDRYDFDSLRLGIQPFTSDFRGFLFLDQPIGVRLFGIRDNNRIQYNFAWFRRLEKDINSGLNDGSSWPREDDLFVANIYLQDAPKLGFISQAIIIYNRNREGRDMRFDENGFLSRPSSLFDERGKDYDVFYLGYSGDGHLGRVNLSTSTYYVFGQEDLHLDSRRETDISAFFTAVELSLDLDWIRIRFSGLYASGDSDPSDDQAEGFDAIFENPQFAGADTSYWIRQAIPFIGGGGVALSPRNGVLPSLRPSKEQGQSNFINPGITLLGLGTDFDILPTLRVSANISQLRFNETGVLEALRQQAPIGKNIGTDVSTGVIYRPLLSQNIVLRLSFAALLPGGGYRDLFDDDDLPYSILLNVTVDY